MRPCLVLSLLLVACNPRSFDDFLAPAEAAERDAGTRRDASVIDAAAQEDTVNAEVDPTPLRDASSAQDGEAVDDVDAAAEIDAGTQAGGTKDSCGQLRPAQPMRPGIEDGGVVFAGDIAQHPQLSARSVTDIVAFGGRYWWLFGPSFKANSWQLENTDSVTWSNEQQPYTLDEAKPNAPLPGVFIPAVEADRMVVGSNQQLTHLTGSVIVPPLFGDVLVFYAPSALSFTTDWFDLRALGTRVATIRVNGTQATATPLPQLLFGPDKLSFRFGLREGSYVYLYGCQRNSTGDSGCMVARAPLSQATNGANYQFRTSGGWSNDYSAAGYVLFNARDELSVSYNEFLRSFLAVHLRGNESVIVLQTAPRPEGPWQVLDEIQVPPPPSGGLPMHFTAVEHPELASQCGRKLVITYLHGSLPSVLRRVEVTLRQAPR